MSASSPHHSIGRGEEEGGRRRKRTRRSGRNVQAKGTIVHMRFLFPASRRATFSRRWCMRLVVDLIPPNSYYTRSPSACRMRGTANQRNESVWFCWHRSKKESEIRPSQRKGRERGERSKKDNHSHSGVRPGPCCSTTQARPRPDKSATHSVIPTKSWRSDRYC